MIPVIPLAAADLGELMQLVPVQRAGFALLLAAGRAAFPGFAVVRATPLSGFARRDNFAISWCSSREGGARMCPP